MKNTLLLLILITFFGCDNTGYEGTGVKQEYMGDMLVTIAKFKHETVWQEFDKIYLDTIDSIKCVRYKEGEKWVNKFKTVESFKCEIKK